MKLKTATNLKDNPTMTMILNDANETLIRANELLSSGENCRQMQLEDLLLVFATRAVAVYLEEQATEAHYQLQSWTDRNGYANGLHLTEILRISPIGATLACQMLVINHQLTAHLNSL